MAMTLTIKQPVRPQTQTTLFNIHVAHKTAIQKLNFKIMKQLKNFNKNNPNTLTPNYTHN